MKVNEFKRILESIEVGLFDKWMVQFEKVQGIYHSLDNYLCDPNCFVLFAGVGLYDDNDTQETKQYWWDLMDKYNEIMEGI